MNLVLKNKNNQIIRVFRCETEKACLVYHKNKGRLDISSSPDFFEKDSIVLLDELSLKKTQPPRPVPIIQGILEICDDISAIRLPPPPAVAPRAQNFWSVLACVLGGYALLYGLFSLVPMEKAEMREQRSVKIIKPPAVVQPENVVLGDRQMFMPNSTDAVKKKKLKKPLKKIGALAALGSLSKKDSSQRGGLNLGASQVSTGPGFKAVSSHSASGGAQDSLYSQGMIMAALGSGGNIRGGGGYGIKGAEPGGGAGGYGKLDLIGSGGAEDLSMASALDSQGGHFNPSAIDREISKQIGQIRTCYDIALKTEPDLKGLFKIYFAVAPGGKVVSSKVHSSSEVRSQKISACILGVVNQIQFPVQLMAAVGINYAFDLSALDTEGRE